MKGAGITYFRITYFRVNRGLARLIRISVEEGDHFYYYLEWPNHTVEVKPVCSICFLKNVSQGTARFHPLDRLIVGIFQPMNGCLFMQKFTKRKSRILVPMILLGVVRFHCYLFPVFDMVQSITVPNEVSQINTTIWILSSASFSFFF